MHVTHAHTHKHMNASAHTKTIQRQHQQEEINVTEGQVLSKQGETDATKEGLSQNGLSDNTPDTAQDLQARLKSIGSNPRP